MKTLLPVILAGALVAPVSAQLFGPESLTGALFGGIAGGVIGHNNGRRSAEGAAIGAGVGAVLGAIARNERRAEAGYPAETVSYDSRPPHAMTGLVLGGIAGGVIGHNNGRHTAEGVAIGAGAGLLLGTLADQERRSVSVTPPPRFIRVTQSPPIASSPGIVIDTPAVPVAENVILRSYPGGSVGPGMSGANALFGR
jgi:hypothetical protein